MDRHIKQNLTGQSHSEWDMPSKPFLTIGEVANLLQVSNRTVYNLIYKGTLRACKITYHITLITKEDFFLMIKETTYCKRNTSIFAKQIKKNKEKMKADIQNTDKVSSFQQEGKKKTKSTPTKRQLIPSSNYKQSVRDTFTEDKNVGGDLYTMAEICQKFNYTYGRFYNLRMRYSIPCVKANSTPHETLFMLISIECVKNTATIHICRIIQIHKVFRFSFIVPFCAFIVLD